MDRHSAPHLLGEPDAQLTMLSTAGRCAWVSTFRNRPPILSIRALGSEISIALPQADRRAELVAIRQLAAVISTFADMTESGWLYPPTVPNPGITDELLTRVLAGLRLL